MLRIRFARRGRRNLNVFAIVAAESSFRRDGRFVERLGYYQPTLANDNPYRFSIDKERFDYWVSKGAQPSEKISVLLAKRGMGAMPFIYESPKKSAPKAKAVERMKEKAEKVQE